MALPAGLAKQRRDLTKLWLKWRVALIAALAALIALVGANFGYQKYVESSRAQAQTEFEETAAAVAKGMADAIETELQRVTAAVDVAALTEALKRGPSAIEQAEAELAGAADKLLGARLLTVDASDTDYESVPPISFATLDMLRRSKKQGENPPPEVHLFGAEGQHVAGVRRLTDGDELIGYLLLGIDLSLLTDAIQSVNVGAGYAELVQKAGGQPLVLAKRGDVAMRQGPASLRTKVAGTRWRVAYWMPGTSVVGESESGALVVPVVSIVVVLMAVCAAAAVLLRRRRVAVKAPSGEFQPAGDDLSEKLAALRRGGPQPGPEPALTGEGEAPDAPPAAATEPAPKVEVAHSIFRAYDIRGVVGKTLSADVVHEIGRAIGSEAYDRGQQTLVVGRDGRLPGPELSEALVAGLRATGRDVIDIGSVPTPVLYFATHYLNTGSGVMVTGSHNPAQYNGIKIMLGGDTLFGDDIVALRTRIESGEFTTGDGSYQNMEVVDEYIRRVSEDIPVALGSSFKVVVDSGNGIAGAVAPKLLRALGHDVTELYCDVDGNFPNHHPDPSQPENLEALIRTVKEQEADIGFAFDGDGDRLGVVDSCGKILWPDRQMMLYAVDVLSRNQGAEIVFDVKCTSRLAKVIKAKGGKPVMWKTGHSFIKSRLRESGAPLAGEMSGHIFFQERWYGFDDAIYASARMLEILMGLKQAPSAVFAKLPSGISTPELRVDMQEGQHLAFMDNLIRVEPFKDGQVTTIDGLRVDYPDGWGLVRASNTTPCLVLRFEGDNQEALARVQSEFKKVLLNADSTLTLPF